MEWKLGRAGADSVGRAARDEWMWPRVPLMDGTEIPMDGRDVLRCNPPFDEYTKRTWKTHLPSPGAPLEGAYPWQPSNTNSHH